MKKMNSLAKFGAGTLGALALTFGGAGIAGAQDDVTPDTDATESVEEDARSGRHEARQLKKAALADIVGLSTDELIEARQSGQSLADIAGDDLDSVVDFLTTHVEERIAAKLDAGRLTEEEAAERRESIDERVAERVTNTEFRERGGRRGFHGNRGSYNAPGGETTNS